MCDRESVIERECVCVYVCERVFYKVFSRYTRF